MAKLKSKLKKDENLRKELEKIITDAEKTGDHSFRVNRGGSWDYDADSCRVTDRNRNSPDYRNYYIGFRLVRAYSS